MQAKSMNAKDWQAQFAASIFGNLSRDLQQTFSDTMENPQQRFSIYRNNVFYSLGQALAELYPVIRKLVGDTFFQATTRAYIHRHPPEQAAMVFFGREFPKFLADFEPARTMRYLVDVAQLEWARHQAYHAADRSAMGLDDFTAITPEVFGQARVELHPSVQCLQSGYPVFRIWQTNQDQANAQTIDLNCSESVIVVRHEYRVNLFQVDPGTYCFYQGLQQGFTVNDALIAAVNTETVGGSSLAEIIALGIQNGFVHSVKISNQKIKKNQKDIQEI